MVLTGYAESSVMLRFPDVEQLESFNIFDPSRLPCDHTNIALKAEWEGFKFLIVQSNKQTSMKEVLKLLVSDKTISRLYLQLGKLAAIALILPISTAECERAFSTMKRIKTALRNRLTTLNLDHLMQISINGPCGAEFDFTKAATAWGNQRQRRIKL